MSTSITTFPASAGTSLGVGSSLGTTLWTRIATAWNEARELRRTFREISFLSDRELTDIGLGADEIHRLRRGDLFQPVGWSTNDIGRDQLPF